MPRSHSCARWTLFCQWSSGRTHSYIWTSGRCNRLLEDCRRASGLITEWAWTSSERQNVIVTGEMLHIWGQYWLFGSCNTAWQTKYIDESLQNSQSTTMYKSYWTQVFFGLCNVFWGLVLNLARTTAVLNCKLKKYHLFLFGRLNETEI